MTEAGLCCLREKCTQAFGTRWPNALHPLVFGDGLAAEPALMLIGEAPGEQESIAGKPFVGKAGKNLDGFLETLKLTRSEIYISNVVKIRPVKESKTGRLSNRPPTLAEIHFFAPWLMKEIALVRPKALVTLGNIALHALMPQAGTIGECHGKWHKATVELKRPTKKAIPLFALYHPASIIYRPELKTTYRQDLEILRDSLHRGGTDS